LHSFSEFGSARICDGENEMDRLTERSGAVSGSCVSSIDSAEDNLVCCRSERGNDANAMFDELEGKELPARKCVDSDGVDNVQVYNNLDVGKRKFKSWLKHFVKKRKGRGDTFVTASIMHQVNLYVG
jgi:hypothetical protein